MFKLFFRLITLFLFLIFLSCQKAKTTGPFDYDRDTPEWLKTKINSLSTNRDYSGTMVYRYEWEGDFVYHIMIPISSCAYCELYDQNGNKIQLAENEEFSGFLLNEKNGIVIWQWQDL